MLGVPYHNTEAVGLLLRRSSRLSRLGCALRPYFTFNFYVRSCKSLGVEGRVSPPIHTYTGDVYTILSCFLRCSLNVSIALLRFSVFTNSSRMGSYSISNILPWKLVIFKPLSCILLWLADTTMPNDFPGWVWLRIDTNTPHRYVICM